MKKRTLGIAALALSTLFASCSKDTDLGLNGPEGNTALAFSFNKPQGSFVTYADIASTAEWNIAAIDVYAAVDGTVTKLATTDYTLTESAKTYTIAMNRAWVGTNAGKTANFYFVGNDATSTLGAHTSLGQTTEADFRNALTNELTDVSGKASLIVKPNGSTQNLLFSTIIENVKVEGKVNKNAVLTRREARFDVENPLYAGDAFKVTDILVSGASTSGLIFPCGDPSVTINKKSHVAVGAIASTEYDAQNLAKSVFYLYPTEMGSGKTEITVMGSVAGGAAKAYPVDASSIGNKIEANTRYILVLDPTTVTFTITVADYNEGGKLPAQLGGDDAFALTNFAASVPANWTEASQVYTFDATAGATLAFDATTKYGTDFEVVYAFGQQADLDVADIVVNKSSVATYSGYNVVDSYTINVPASTHDGFGIRVIIKSIGGTGQQVILFQKGTVEVEDVFVDPQVTEKVKEIIGHDDVTAEDLSGITILDLSGETDVTSLEGIENLPNLTEINAKDNNTITEVDLSKNNELSVINLSGTGISEIDLSKNEKLTKALMSKTALTEVDFSQNAEISIIALQDIPNLTNVIFGAKNQKLSEIHIQGCQSLTSLNVSALTGLKRLQTENGALTTLDVSNNTNLEYLDIRNTQIASIDLSKNVNLLSFCIGGFAGTFNAVINSVDISNNKKITTFRCAYVPFEVTVKVWNDFPQNPAEQFTTAYQIVNSTAVTIVRN